MTEEELILAQSKIDLIPPNTEFGVKELIGNDWAFVTKKQAYGRIFKKSVNTGILINIVHVRLENSPRHDVYRKTS
jgi:hypothetical protein